ncbi:hypothetical protein [Streptomyces sp. NPDC002845]
MTGEGKYRISEKSEVLAIANTHQQPKQEGGEYMGKRKRNSKSLREKRERRLMVRGIRRDPPDMQKLGRALLSLAQAEAERAAQEQHNAGQGADRSAVEEPDTQGGGTGGEQRE